MFTWVRKIAVTLAILLVFTGVTTAAVTVFKLSGDQSFLAEWLPIWMRAAFVIAPLGFLILAGINRVIDLLFGDPSPAWRKVIQSASMPLLMGGLMAGVATVQLHGWGAGFWGFWASAMIAALPMAILVGLLMTYLIKPRSDRVMSA